MVFDVPAESGGALTILKQYYEKAALEVNTNWIFVVSTPKLKPQKNIKVLNYPWIKRNWLLRIIFDKFISYKLIKKFKVDEILSLQNLVISNTKVPQTLYLHQPLPFVEKRYRMFENYKFWIYQNVISKMIYKSIQKADKVIVQTNWMKEACLNKVDTAANKIVVKAPKTNIKVKNYYHQENEMNLMFFYPASSLEYKNHKVIVDASRKLIESGIKNFKVIFTINGDENKLIKGLYETVITNDLPIEFKGSISLERVYEYYSKSILIFPSYIETFGLPLLEAREHKSPIIASNCSFSHEVLNNYSNSHYFNPEDSSQLKSYMEKFITNPFYRKEEENHD